MSGTSLQPRVAAVPAAPASTGGSTIGPSILVGAGLLGLGLSLALAFGAVAPGLLGPYTYIDATARIFLVLINLIFLGIAVHVWTRVQTEVDQVEAAGRSVVLSLIFLVAADLSVISDHFVASWISLELTTLAAAPLVVRAGSPASRLASWRYFLFSSVGLGLTLLGFACVARGLEAGASGSAGLFIHALGAHPPAADPWCTLGIALAILGFATKLGLAPMYIWLPETYDEAPPHVTSLLAAIQFNCALVGLLRVVQVFRGGNEHLIRVELLGLGLASVALATASLIATNSVRRLVAYASILHGGVIAIGLGIGGGAGYGVLLYAVSNAFIKAMLFLSVGRIEAVYGTKDTHSIRGVIKTLPFNGLFLMAGTFALLGFPPFGSFVGELLILSGLVRGGHLLTFATLGFLVSVTFVATGRTVFPMIWGQQAEAIAPERQTFLSFGPKLVFLVVLVVLGLHLPAPVNALFHEVAVSLGDK